MFKFSPKKRTLLRWCGWFFSGNLLLYWLIGFRYWHLVPWINTSFLSLTNKIFLGSFFLTAYVGQFALLTYLPALFVVLLICIIPIRRFVFAVSVLVASAMGMYIMSDVVVYNLYRFHINGIFFKYLMHLAGENFLDFSQYEIIEFACLAFVLIFIEIIYASWLWNRITRGRFLSGVGIWVASLTGVSLYAGYAAPILIVQDNMNRIVVDAMHVLPFYTDTLGAILPIANGQMALERGNEGFLIQPEQASRQLHYPLQTLHFSEKKSRLNIVIIGIDTWRYDLLNAEVTPNIFRFSKEATVYTKHFSGGNATAPGIFSLFYGLPATYWTATEKQKRGPVLIDTLLKNNYKIKILASAGLTLPAFNKNVFVSVPDLTLKFSGTDPYTRDRQVTAEFRNFIDHVSKNQQSFFSFIFYDSAHGFCAIENNDGPFTPVIKKCDRFNMSNTTDPVPYINRYKNSLRLVDEQVGEVINSLKAHHLLKNTVVIITGDHGEEFNDNHQGYWGHSSNFTHYQVQTPLVIYWPDKKPDKIMHQTTHFDVAPMLMETVLGCQTSADQYSIGSSLFKKNSSPYIIVGSYIGFGVVEPTQITNVFSGGFSVSAMDASPMKNIQLNNSLMASAFQKMRRFYYE